MTDQFVVVQAQWAAPSSSGTTTYSNGNFQFIAAGLLMRSASIAVVYPIIQGQLDSLGALSIPTNIVGGSLVAHPPGWTSPGGPNSGVSLLASDSFGPGELLYDIKIQVQGIPDIRAQDIPVNYASGATQGLFGILEAAGWTPNTF